MRELLALAKAKPGHVTYASYGSGSSAHLTAELFKLMAGVDLLHVPYKGAAPAVNDLLGGQVNIVFADVAAMLSHVKSGKLKALGIGSAKRFEGLPDVPTIAESGVPGFEAGGFLGLVAPAGTPPAVDCGAQLGRAEKPWRSPRSASGSWRSQARPSAARPSSSPSTSTARSTNGRA